MQNTDDQTALVPFQTSREVMSEEHLRFRVNLAERIARHDMVWGEAPTQTESWHDRIFSPSSGPPASWKEGAPLGNGDFGALVYGGFDNLSFALGKTDLWDRSGPGKSNFPDGTFQEFRQTYFNRDEEAYRQFSQRREDYHEQHATTAGMFRLHLMDADMVASQALRVSLHDGIARLTGVPSRDRLHRPAGEAAVEMLASRAYKVLAVRVRPTGFPLEEIAWELSRERHEPHPNAGTHASDDAAWLHQVFKNRDDYFLAVTADGAPFRVTATARRLVGEVGPVGTKEVTFYLTIVTSRDAADPLGEALSRLARAREAGFEEIAREHRAWWQDYWKRAYVCIEDEAAEKWWYTSLYLCGSTLEPGCQSPGLQGVWIKENVPAWWGDYHSNVNIQAVYWGLYASNRVDLLEPYVRLLQSFVPQCKRDTEQYFQMRGIRFPHAGGIDGYELTGGNYSLLGVSVGGTSWLTQLLWQVYEYTGDHEFLQDTVYPLLRDAALFYEDYLTWDEGAGRHAVEPSVHFEALLPRYEGWGKNSAYELTLTYGVFERVVAAAAILDTDPEDRTRWEDILAKLPDFPTDEEGRVWVSFDGRDVRETGSHQYALAPVFPGQMVSLWHGPEEWRERALRTLEDAATKKTCTGKPWCGGQGILEIIRLGKAEEALAAARWSGNNTNGLVFSWSSPYLQADHGPGMCSVLSDMLLLGVGGVLRVFPCFPKRVPAAFHSLRAPGAFLVSAEKRGEEVDYVLVKSLAGSDLSLANPWPGEALRIRDLSSREEVAATDEGVVRLPTQPGQELVVDRPSTPYESIPVHG